MVVSRGGPWSAGSVSLRPLQVSDVDARYVAWMQDPDVLRYLESRFAQHTEQSIRAFVASCVAAEDVLLLGIFDERFGGHVGNLKIGPVDRHHGLAELGILIGAREAWGHGVATAALSLSRVVAREVFGLRKLTAGCYASNVGSERAFLRAGFEREGVRPRHFLLNGVPEDLVLLACHIAPTSTDTL